MCWTPNPQCDGLRRWGLGRCSGHEGGAFMSGISVLEKRLQRPLVPSIRWGHSKRVLSVNQKGGSHHTQPCWCLDLGASRTVSHDIFASCKLPRLWYFVIAAWIDRHCHLIGWHVPAFMETSGSLCTWKVALSWSGCVGKIHDHNLQRTVRASL